MLSSSRNVLLELSETTSPKKLFTSDCITLYNKLNPNSNIDRGGVGGMVG